MWPTTGKKCVFIHRNRDEMRNQISPGTLQHRKRNKRKEFRPLFVCSPIKCWRMLQRRSRQELSIEKETMPQNRQHNNQMNTRPCIKLNFFHSFVWFVAAVVFFIQFVLYATFYMALSVISLSQTLITYIFGVERTQWPMDLCSMDSITWISLVLFAQFLLPCHYLHTQIDLIMAMDASLLIRTLNGEINTRNYAIRFGPFALDTQRFMNMMEMSNK